MPLHIMRAAVCAVWSFHYLPNRNCSRQESLQRLANEANGLCDASFGQLISLREQKRRHIGVHTPWKQCRKQQTKGARIIPHTDQQAAREEVARLLRALAAGDRSAMRPLYNLTASRLFAIILRVTVDRTAAEDILQETYIKVWNKAGSFREGCAEPFAWLATIARNGAIDWRKAHYQRKFSTSNDFAHIEDEAETVEDRIERYQQEIIIAEALGNLSKDREIEVREVFFTGLTYAELAERANIPVATVKSRVRRSLIHLRSRLNND